MVEHLTFNQGVPRSIRGRPTTPAVKFSWVLFGPVWFLIYGRDSSLHERVIFVYVIWVITAVVFLRERS